MTNYDLLLLYAQQHTITAFRKYPLGYVFCETRDCNSCKVKEACDSAAIFASPKISKKELYRFLKEHPEYAI